MTLRVHPDDIVRESTSGLLAAHESWERVRLGDVANVLNGFAFRSSFFTKSEGVPLLRIRDVGQSATDACYSGPFDDTYLVCSGELVVGMDGDFRAARWSGPDAVLNQRVCKLTVRHTDLYDPGFLAYVIQGYLDAINARTSAVTVKHLSSRTVQDIPLPLPPRNEQRRIVAAIEEHLSRLDVADSSLVQAQARLAQLRRVASSAPFERDWPIESLAEVNDPERPIRYGILMPKEHVDDGVLYVRVRDYPHGFVELEGLKRTSHEIAAKYKRSTLQTGDILLAIRGTYGRVAIVPQELERGNITQDTARIAPVERLEHRYVAAYLRSDGAQRYFRRVARGVAVKGVNIGDLRTMPIPVPPLDEQRRIVAQVEEQLSAIDALDAAIERAERRSRSLRRAVLERAFRGELIQQDSGDEPASALLARILSEAEAAPAKARRRRVSA